MALELNLAAPVVSMDQSAASAQSPSPGGLISEWLSILGTMFQSETDEGEEIEPEAPAAAKPTEAPFLTFYWPVAISNSIELAPKVQPDDTELLLDASAQSGPGVILQPGLWQIVEPTPLPVVLPTPAPGPAEAANQSVAPASTPANPIAKAEPTLLTARFKMDDPEVEASKPEAVTATPTAAPEHQFRRSQERSDSREPSERENQPPVPGLTREAGHTFVLAPPPETAQPSAAPRTEAPAPLLAHTIEASITMPAEVASSSPMSLDLRISGADLGDPNASPQSDLRLQLQQRGDEILMRVQGSGDGLSARAQSEWNGLVERLRPEGIEADQARFAPIHAMRESDPWRLQSTEAPKGESSADSGSARNRQEQEQRQQQQRNQQDRAQKSRVFQHIMDTDVLASRSLL